MNRSSNGSGMMFTRRAFNLLLAGGAAALAANPAMRAFAQANAGTLTLALSTPPISLDPGRNGAGVNEAYLDPIYEPLVYLDQDGVAHPGLAESFGYVGEGNKLFEIKLRPGLVFADGTALDAEAVKTYLEYYKVAGGPFGAGANVIESYEIADPLTLRLVLSSAVPNLVRQFSSGGLWGSIPNPKTVTGNPESLGNASDGVGQYVLDTAATVSGSEFVYTPNPHYYDQSKIQWAKIVLRVIDSPNSRLQALMARQVDFTELDAQTALAAKGAGATVEALADSWLGLFLEDRDGKVLPEMGDERFRRAINHAIDRATIARGLFGDYAVPTQQITVPGRPGYTAELDSYYDYNPDKARELLKEAGIGAVTFTAVAPTFVAGNVNVAQAVASQLAAVGITMQIETPASFPAFAEMSESAKYPAIVFSWGVGDTYDALLQQIMPTGVVNPFKTVDNDMIALMDRIAGTNPEKAADDYKALIKLIVERAWFAPILRTGGIFAWNNTVGNTLNSLSFPNPTMMTAGA